MWVLILIKGLKNISSSIKRLIASLQRYHVKSFKLRSIKHVSAKYFKLKVVESFKLSSISVAIITNLYGIDEKTEDLWWLCWINKFYWILLWININILLLLWITNSILLGDFDQSCRRECISHKCPLFPKFGTMQKLFKV